MLNILYTVIIYPVTQIIEFIFVFANKMFKDTGISLMFVSLSLSILTLPLYIVAEKWQQIERRIQDTMSSKIKKIKSAFKGDERYMVLSAYYRQNNYHPIYALRSSFGLLIQVPFFIAAYSYINNSIDLFPEYLTHPNINLLLIMTFINLLSSYIYTFKLKLKEKLPLFVMAVLFFILLFKSPAALVLYWTLNNLFSLFKNIYFKIQNKYKKLFLFSLISFLCLLLAYYSIFVHHGSPATRYLIAVISLITGIAPWLFTPLKYAFLNIKPVLWKPKETLYLFILSIVILWIAIGFFVPSMLINSSAQEFSYIDTVNSPLTFLFTVLLQAFGLFVFWPLLIFFLFSYRIKIFLSFFMSIAAVCVLCNIFVFSGNYGTISSHLVFTNTIYHGIKEILFNLLILLTLSCLLFLLYIKGKKSIFSFLNITFISALAVFSCINIFLINKEYKALTGFYTPGVFAGSNIEPVFQLSKTGSNVIIFMLDMAQSVFFPFIIEETPELSKKYSGFVYYPNTVSYNGWTTGGTPPIFGGYDFTPQALNERNYESLKDKINSSLLFMPKLFSENNYSVIFTDPPYANGNWVPDISIFDNYENVTGLITDGVYTDYWLSDNNISLPAQSAVLKRNILWYSVFRGIPLAFRQAVYYSGSWCAPFSEHRLRLFLNGYAVLNYLEQLTDFNPKTENTLLILVNYTAHENTLLQAPEYKPELNVSTFGTGKFSKEPWYHVNKAAILRLSEYFDFLKEQNVYNNTRIIIVSDHGCLDNSYVTKTNLPFHVDQFNPLLLYKDFNSEGDLSIDNFFMTNADTPFLAVNNLIDIDLRQLKEEPQLIIIDRMTLKNEYEYDINRNNSYFVKNNIFIESNWSKP